MSSYFTKYLKYKNKYLELQKIKQNEERYKVYLNLEGGAFPGGGGSSASNINVFNPFLYLDDIRISIDAINNETTNINKKKQTTITVFNSHFANINTKLQSINTEIKSNESLLNDLKKEQKFIDLVNNCIKDLKQNYTIINSVDGKNIYIIDDKDEILSNLKNIITKFQWLSNKLVKILSLSSSDKYSEPKDSDMSKPDSGMSKQNTSLKIGGSTTGTNFSNTSDDKSANRLDESQIITSTVSSSSELLKINTILDKLKNDDNSNFIEDVFILYEYIQQHLKQNYYAEKYPLVELIELTSSSSSEELVSSISNIELVDSIYRQIIADIDIIIELKQQIDPKFIMPLKFIKNMILENFNRYNSVSFEIETLLVTLMSYIIKYNNNEGIIQAIRRIVQKIKIQEEIKDKEETKDKEELLDIFCNIYLFWHHINNTYGKKEGCELFIQNILYRNIYLNKAMKYLKMNFNLLYTLFTENNNYIFQILQVKNTIKIKEGTYKFAHLPSLIQADLNNYIYCISFFNFIHQIIETYNAFYSHFNYFIKSLESCIKTLNETYTEFTKKNNVLISILSYDFKINIGTDINTIKLKLESQRIQLIKQLSKENAKAKSNLFSLEHFIYINIYNPDFIKLNIKLLIDYYNILNKYKDTLDIKKEREKYILIGKICLYIKELLDPYSYFVYPEHKDKLIEDYKSVFTRLTKKLPKKADTAVFNNDITTSTLNNDIPTIFTTSASSAAPNNDINTTSASATNNDITTTAASNNNDITTTATNNNDITATATSSNDITATSSNDNVISTTATTATTATTSTTATTATTATATTATSNNNVISSAAATTTSSSNNVISTSAADKQIIKEKIMNDIKSYQKNILEASTGESELLIDFLLQINIRELVFENIDNIIRIFDAEFNFKYLSCYTPIIENDQSYKYQYKLIQYIILFIIGNINDQLNSNNKKMQYLIKGGSAMKLMLAGRELNISQEDENSIKRFLNIPNENYLFSSNDIDIIPIYDMKEYKIRDQDYILFKKCLCLILAYKLIDIIYDINNNIKYMSPAEKNNRSDHSSSLPSMSSILLPHENILSENISESNKYPSVYKISLPNQFRNNVLIDIDPFYEHNIIFEKILLQNMQLKNSNINLSLYVPTINEFIYDKVLFLKKYQDEGHHFYIQKFKKYIDFFQAIDFVKRTSYLSSDYYDFLNYNSNIITQIIIVPKYIIQTIYTNFSIINTNFNVEISIDEYENIKISGTRDQVFYANNFINQIIIQNPPPKNKTN